MNANLLTLAQHALGGEFSKLAGQFLGESQGATQSALGSLLPAVLGGIAQKGATPQGASGLLSLIDGARLDVSSLGNIKGLNANSLSSLLSGQGQHLQGALDSRMSSALGLTSPGAFLSGLASVEMKPPMFVEVGAGGGDAEARRVEINRQ